MASTRHIIVYVETYPDRIEAVMALCERLGTTRIDVISKLVEWFAFQPEDIQTAIAQGDPGNGGNDVLTQILQQMAVEDPARLPNRAESRVISH